MISWVEKICVDGMPLGYHVGLINIRTSMVNPPHNMQDAKDLFDEVVQYARQHNPEWLEELK